MKPRVPFRIFLAVWLPLLVAGAPGLSAAPAAGKPAPAKPAEMPKSIFIYPTNPSQGRDPFFPDSTRPYRKDSPTPAAAPIAAGALELKSILNSGTQVLAIINNHAFAPGDKGEVLTSDGRRLHIKLLAIKLKTKSAVVQVDGQNIDLFLPPNP